jgi:hypothetical protein
MLFNMTVCGSLYLGKSCNYNGGRLPRSTRFQWKRPECAKGTVTIQVPVRARVVYSELLEISPTHAKACERIAALDAEEKAETPSAPIPRFYGGKN